MTVLLTSHGSRGDVYPMISLARQFQGEGHDTLMYTQELYRRELESHGIRGIFTTEDMHKEMADLGSDWKSVRKMFAWTKKSLAEEFQMLEGPMADAELVVSTNQEFSVAHLADLNNVPAYRLSYIPAIPADHTPPLIPWQDLPVPVNRMIWKGLGMGLNHLARDMVNNWRKERDMPPVKDLTSYMTSISHTLYGFSEALAPPHPSWDRETYSYSGYCFEQEDEQLPADLVRFLDAGEKPIYLGFGSVTVPDPDKVTATALEAAEAVGCRLIFGKGWTALGADHVLETKQKMVAANRVKVVEDVSHTRLFSRLAGACHHGGAGTTHRAMRAGIPQFIMPLIVDQFFWGHRIFQSSAGPKPMRPKKLTVKALARVFDSFVNGDEYALGATRLAHSFSREDGSEAAYKAIMAHLRRQAA